MRLGYLQKQMMDFINRHPKQDLFSIARTEKQRAIALEKRGLIRIVNKNWLCWQVMRPEREVQS